MNQKNEPPSLTPDDPADGTCPADVADAIEAACPPDPAKEIAEAFRGALNADRRAFDALIDIANAKIAEAMRTQIGAPKPLEEAVQRELEARLLEYPVTMQGYNDPGPFHPDFRRYDPRTPEPELPEPYTCGPDVLDPARYDAEVTPFKFELLEVKWSRPVGGSLSVWRGNKTCRIVMGVYGVPSLSLDAAGFETDLDHRAPVPKGKPTTISVGLEFPADRPDALCLRELIMFAMRHELEENMYAVDRQTGRRIRLWDPHEGKGE